LSRCETTTMSLYSEDMRPREFLVSPCSWPPVIATTQSNCQNSSVQRQLWSTRLHTAWVKKMSPFRFFWNYPTTENFKEKL